MNRRHFLCTAASVSLLTVRDPGGGADKEELKEIAVDLGGGVTMEMSLIPAGSFTMGDDYDARAKPAHKVTITKPFYLGKYEVTQEQWQTVMGDNPSKFKGPKNPVEQVSWDDCQTFFGKLNEKQGSTGAKFSLPTEAQWEYACRAGSASRWGFGDEESNLGEYAWYDGNSGGKTHPVGEKKPSAWGLFDMHGNVWEWCQDWYGKDYYANSPGDNPRGPATGSFRVDRGGGWLYAAWLCRSAFRDYGSPGYGYRYLGFRVSRVAD